jgi:glycosyltransferase involved in cell wall biosynthesis
MLQNSLNVGSVTICMPILNEASVVHSVMDEWTEVLQKLPQGSKILIEDGGSKDGTREILRDYEARYKGIEIIYKDKPEGFGKAAKNLLSSAGTEWVFFTDSDGQYVASDFWKLWERRKNVDLVRGIKLGRKDPVFRVFTSFVWNRVIRFMFGIPINDINVAFFLVKKSKLSDAISKCVFLDQLVVSELMIRLITNNCLFGNDVYILHRQRNDGKSRAIPAHKVFQVGVSHLIGLHKIKKDFRLNY